AGCLTGRTTGDRAGDMNFDHDGEVMRCPWHGFEFSLIDGAPAVPPPNGQAMSLRFYPVAVEQGRVLVSA
ncbi:MAG: 2Fe-2S ferredoxin, partial [Pseudomonadota bacterium]